MTYNFDPEGWLDRQRAALAARLERGEIDRADFDRESAELDRRYEDMVERLDGTYEIPGDG
jgi:Arc/MetJ-type ribon-helix-helix transcriptional regulator